MCVCVLGVVTLPFSYAAGLIISAITVNAFELCEIFTYKLSVYAL